MSRLAGKVALVAGATGGIGRTTAEMFAEQGAKVVVAGRRQAEGDQVASGIVADGGDAIYVRTDVTDPDSVDSAVRTTVSHYGKLDVLFSNAGGSSPQDSHVTSVPIEEFWKRIQVDLFGTFLCSRYAIPEIVKSGGGSVVNMSSLAGHGLSPGRDAYSSAKGAVLALTRSSARAYAADKVRVNAIAPAAVRTDRILRLFETMPGAEELLRAQVLGLIDQRDIAYAAIYLASDESRTLTGQTITINAGLF